VNPTITPAYTGFAMPAQQPQRVCHDRNHAMAPIEGANASIAATALAAPRALRLRKSKSRKFPIETLFPIELSMGPRGIAPRVPMPKLPSCEWLSNDIVIV
jgi:hypothetical protein